MKGVGDFVNYFLVVLLIDNVMNFFFGGYWGEVGKFGVIDFIFYNCVSISFKIYKFVFVCMELIGL